VHCSCWLASASGKLLMIRTACLLMQFTNLMLLTINQTLQKHKEGTCGSNVLLQVPQSAHRFCSWQGQKRAQITQFWGLEKASETHQSLKIVEPCSTQLIKGSSFTICVNSCFEMARQQFGSKIELFFAQNCWVSSQNAQAKGISTSSISGQF